MSATSRYNAALFAVVAVLEIVLLLSLVVPTESMRSLSTGFWVPVPSGVVPNTNDAGPSLVAKV